MKHSKLAAIMLAGGILAAPAVAAANPPASIEGDTPSCSLYPHRLGHNEYVFENKNPNGNWAIPITVWNQDNSEIQYRSWLFTGDTTPILTLLPDTAIGWSNNAGPGNQGWIDNPFATYQLKDYEAENWCGSPGPGTTTTTTTAAPVTTTTVPAVVTTVPLPTPELTCEELGRANIPATDPLYRYDLDTDGDGLACDADVSVAGVVATRQLTPPDDSAVAVQRGPLPMTGAKSTPWMGAAAAALIAVGAGLVTRTRRLSSRNP